MVMRRRGIPLTFISSPFPNTTDKRGSGWDESERDGNRIKFYIHRNQYRTADECYSNESSFRATIPKDSQSKGLDGDGDGDGMKLKVEGGFKGILEYFASSELAATFNG